jgi:hypothetical protein
MEDRNAEARKPRSSYDPVSKKHDSRIRGFVLTFRVQQ